MVVAVGMEAAAVRVVFFLAWCRRQARAMRSKWEPVVQVPRNIQMINTGWVSRKVGRVAQYSA